jgi:hypothetical protein
MLSVTYDLLVIMIKIIKYPLDTNNIENNKIIYDHFFY